MIRNDSDAAPAASQLADAETRSVEIPCDLMDPRSPIEVASSGSGTTNDPAATDTKPPTGP